MLVLRPYSIPMNPNRNQVTKLLGNQGLLIGAEDRELDDGNTMTLKTWAREEPEFETIENREEFTIIKVFIQYIEKNPETDFNLATKKTKENWQPHRLSRIVTLWIPLRNNLYDFLLSVGDIREQDVKALMSELLPGIDEESIKGWIYDFIKVRERNKEGWMHGCENRPKTIQRGSLYGDFHFDEPSELNDFLERPDKTTRSNQEGIIISPRKGYQKRKVRVLRFGKFQLMGIPKDNFYRGPERAEVMNECFATASKLRKARA